MLLELVVENYAVVERVRIRFYHGLNLLTGETGSGKSIVVDALGLLFGGRASADMVRSGTDRARISGIFEVPHGEASAGLLTAAGVEAEDGELLIAREILAGGKSRAFAASRPVTSALLRELAPHLGDIHGQHDQQLLFSSETQLRMLDEFAGCGELACAVADLFREWQRVGRTLEELDRSEQEKLRLLDLWNFQRKEIETVAPKPGEEGNLENERAVLKNVSRLLESANAAYAAVYDEPKSASAQIGIALKRLEELCRIDASMQAAAETLRSAYIGVGEASGELRSYLERLEADPDRLDQVESRLAALDRLKRKYGSSIEEVLRFLEGVRAEIDTVENAAGRRAKLDAELRVLAERYAGAAGELTKVRVESAEKLAGRVKRELKSLAMSGSVFRIAMNPAAWSERGTDKVEFLISANPGEEPRPLDRVASGGELSRIALALKTCTGMDHPGINQGTRPAGVARTLVFDEVDAGIGGSVAEAVGRRLKKLAETDQVLCVTHLAQIAGFADHHYQVEKRELKGRTVAEVEELTGEARTREIGRMLSGQKVTPEALKHAEQLLRLGKEGA
ncbi:MAG: DNA repair protein RecN [Bryobacteraceae bacterium]